MAFGVEQDCGYEVSAIQGIVRDSNNQKPIVDAQVTVKSLGVGSCPGSERISDVIIITDEQGRFFHPVTIAADNQMEITISAPGCNSFHQEDIFIDFFEAVGKDYKGLPVYLFCRTTPDSETSLFETEEPTPAS